jgi:hypothetical protein
VCATKIPIGFRCPNYVLGKLQLLYDTDQLRFCGQTSPQDFAGLMKSVRKRNWIVYAKAPFGGPQSVLDYLGSYTHRVAISNHRLVSIDKGQIRFTYKDRSANNRTRILTVTASEFLRRFLLHVLPRRFVKIRYFGFAPKR